MTAVCPDYLAMPFTEFMGLPAWSRQTDGSGKSIRFNYVAWRRFVTPFEFTDEDVFTCATDALAVHGAVVVVVYEVPIHSEAGHDIRNPKDVTGLSPVAFFDIAEGRLYDDPVKAAKGIGMVIIDVTDPIDASTKIASARVVLLVTEVWTDVGVDDDMDNQTPAELYMAPLTPVIANNVTAVMIQLQPCDGDVCAVLLAQVSLLGRRVLTFASAQGQVPLLVHLFDTAESVFPGTCDVVYAHGLCAAGLRLADFLDPEQLPLLAFHVEGLVRAATAADLAAVQDRLSRRPFNDHEHNMVAAGLISATAGLISAT